VFYNLPVVTTGKSKNLQKVETANNYSLLKNNYQSMLVCFFKIWLWFMVFYATFNNISVISWWPVLLVEETGVPGENH
jgi:hypothetical protein